MESKRFSLEEMSNAIISKLTDLLHSLKWNRPSKKKKSTFLKHLELVATKAKYLHLFLHLFLIFTFFLKFYFEPSIKMWKINRLFLKQFEIFKFVNGLCINYVALHLTDTICSVIVRHEFLFLNLFLAFHPFWFKFFMIIFTWYIILKSANQNIYIIFFTSGDVWSFHRLTT